MQGRSESPGCVLMSYRKYAGERKHPDQTERSSNDRNKYE